MAIEMTNLFVVVIMAWFCSWFCSWSFMLLMMTYKIIKILQHIADKLEGKDHE